MGEDSLGYEETLSSLLALIGTPVTVVVEGRDGYPLGAALLEGELVRGEANDAFVESARSFFGAELGEVMFFRVGDGAAFMVARSDFRRSLRHAGGLAIEAGNVVTHVLPSARSNSSGS